jgi:succinate-semialdehyde dehydrogenase/glutarate-semialdehyde dehydrogenase
VNLLVSLIHIAVCENNLSFRISVDQLLSKTGGRNIDDRLGNSSAAESPFGGIKESGHGKESGKDVAVAEYFITKTGTLTLED